MRRFKCSACGATDNFITVKYRQCEVSGREFLFCKCFRCKYTWSEQTEHQRVCQELHEAIKWIEYE